MKHSSSWCKTGACHKDELNPQASVLEKALAHTSPQCRMCREMFSKSDLFGIELGSLVCLDLLWVIFRRL